MLTARMVPLAAPPTPIAAARPSPTASSWPRRMPRAPSVPSSADSRKEKRASSWPRISRPMIPRTAATSHNATACR